MSGMVIGQGHQFVKIANSTSEPTGSRGFAHPKTPSTDKEMETALLPAPCSDTSLETPTAGGEEGQDMTTALVPLPAPAAGSPS